MDKLIGGIAEEIMKFVLIVAAIFAVIGWLIGMSMGEDKTQ